MRLELERGAEGKADGVHSVTDEYTVKLQTTEGAVLIDVHRAWAPNGADRFYNLVVSGYSDDTYFFRTIAGFMTQVGIHGDPAATAAWREAPISPDLPSHQAGTGLGEIGGIRQSASQHQHPTSRPSRSGTRCSASSPNG